MKHSSSFGFFFFEDTKKNKDKIIKKKILKELYSMNLMLRRNGFTLV